MTPSPLDITHIVNLRQVVMSMMEVIRTQYPKGVRTIESEDYGRIELSDDQGCMLIKFNDYNRLFAIGKDNVLVERVAVLPPTPLDRPINPLEGALLDIIKEEYYSNVEGETVPVQYGEEREVCLVTHTRTGILGDFPDGTKLIYDFRSNRVHKYRPPRAQDPRKVKGEDKPNPPDMVEQLGYGGEVELVDRRVFCNKLVCKCGGVRWVKNADVFQVKLCKPCRRAKKNEGRRRGSSD